MIFKDERTIILLFIYFFHLENIITKISLVNEPPYKMGKPLQPHVHHSFLSEKLHYLLCSFCSFCQDCSFGLKLMCPLQGKLVYVSAFYLKDLFYIFIHARLSQLILSHVLYLLFCKFVKLYDWMLQVSEGTDDAATSYLVHLLSDLNTLLKKVSSDVRHQGD